MIQLDLLNEEANRVYLHSDGKCVAYVRELWKLYPQELERISRDPYFGLGFTGFKPAYENPYLGGQILLAVAPTRQDATQLTNTSKWKYYYSNVPGPEAGQYLIGGKFPSPSYDMKMWDDIQTNVGDILFESMRRCVNTWLEDEGLVTSKRLGDGMW